MEAPIRRRMTVLQMYAQHGSTSYGPITPERLREILLGDVPTEAECVRAEQAMLEIPVHRAHDLAAELGIPYQALNARAVELFGVTLEKGNTFHVRPEYVRSKL